MKTNQRGSALIYILIAVALLAALTGAFMSSGGQQVSSQNSYNITTELKNQADTIRSAIQECILNYPKGDAGIAGTGAVGGETPVRPYPLNPNNTYLPSNPTPGYNLASDISCPGNPGDSNNHARIFSASSGKFLPQPPNLFSVWMYYNNIDGVFILITTDKTDAYLQSALQKLDASYSKCESQYIDARAGTIQTTSNSNPGYQCAAGRQCFRLWIRPTATATYPGETGCP